MIEAPQGSMHAVGLLPQKKITYTLTYFDLKGKHNNSAFKDTVFY